MTEIWQAMSMKLFLDPFIVSDTVLMDFVINTNIIRLKNLLDWISLSQELLVQSMIIYFWAKEIYYIRKLINIKI